MAIEMVGTDSIKALDAVTVYGANIARCVLILGLLWLCTANPQIEWSNKTVLFGAQSCVPFTTQAKTLRSITRMAQDVSAVLTPSTSQVSSNHTPGLEMVTLEEFINICEEESSKAYLMQYRGASSSVDEWNVGAFVGAVMEEDKKGGKDEEPVFLPAQYSDFADVFDKRGADVLPQHTQHDLAIETEDNKVPPFGPTYDHSRLELEVLREYIDEMLAKGFIVPSKSPLGAPVLFTKKSDGGLRMCVDF